MIEVIGVWFIANIILTMNQTDCFVCAGEHMELCMSFCFVVYMVQYLSLIEVIGAYSVAI